MSDADSRERLESELSLELRALGGFFAADVHPSGAVASGCWQPLRTLLDEADRLSSRIELVRRSLGPGATIRVAASVAHLGMVARLVAPALAASALGFGPLCLDPTELWWQGELTGAFALSVAEPPNAGERQQPVGGMLSELTDLVRNRYRVPSRTLWGNVGSAVNTASVLVAQARPARAAAARDAADVILADPRIDGGQLRSGPSFRRRSCCLIYQAFDPVSGRRSALCQDCVLAPR